MSNIRTRCLHAGVISTAIVLLSACGSGGDNGADGDGSAALHPAATAVSANVPEYPSLAAKGATQKVDPLVRPGAKAPLDSTPDTSASGGSAGAGSSPADTSKRVFATGFESGVVLTEPTGYRQGDRQLVGTDSPGYSFPVDLWSTTGSWRSWVLSTVGEVTRASATEFLEASIKSVAARSGGLSNALSLNSKVQSGGGGSQQIVVQNAGMGVEAVMYQRMWLKFDTGMLARAHAAGPANFYQTFWEATALPDLRIGINIRYDHSAGLYWQVQADLLDGNAPAWESDLKSVPIVLAPSMVAAGWHKVEIWMDRPNGRFKAAIDGHTLVDRTGHLMGQGRNPVDHLKMMMVNSHAAPLAEVLFDDLEIWSEPPADAWQGQPR